MISKILEKYSHYGINYDLKNKAIYLSKKIYVEDFIQLKIDLKIYRIDYKNIIVGMI